MDRIEYTAREILKRYGYRPAALELAMHGLHRLCYLLAVHGMLLSKEAVERAGDNPLPAHFGMRLLTGEEVRRLANVPDSPLGAAPVEALLAKGDRCFGVFADDGRLANYGWYASTPSPLTDQFAVRFDPRFVLMHNNFTHPDFRGRRLHAAGILGAARALGDRRFDGVISAVDVRNIAALRASERVGFDIFGQLFIFGRLGRYLHFADRGCRERGFVLEPVDESVREVPLFHMP